MKKLSSIALAMALAVGGASLAAAPALAQQEAAPAAAPERKISLSKGAQKAIVALQEAVNAKDDAAYAAALPAAQSAAKNTDDRYFISQMQLRWGIAKQDERLQLQAVEALVASGGATPEETVTAYQNIAALKTRLGDTAGAEAAFAKFAESQPNNPDVIISQAEMKATANQPAEALVLFDKAIEAKKAAGQPVPEAWYKRALKFAYEGKNKAASASLSRDLIAAYPTPENWRDGLEIYRSMNTLDREAEIDLMRLQRSAKLLKTDRDYFDLAENLNDKGLPGETVAVLDEGISAGVVNRSRTGFKELYDAADGKIADDRQSLPAGEKKALAAATGKEALAMADAYYGYGNYAKAVELYRAALEKGSVDTNVVNTRLGMALAMSGNKAEADTAFKAVTGPRQEIASFWVLWLDQRA